ncbi:Gfo/Idh/MocA family oxidoreductase [Nocardia beijingensis]|uniref:Gfo/Idh/MocA family protein n=1 Tax=Nocardia beijingensis TaxID=95162 RepID=UPI001892DB38|nr:Gfo/Idh/MocA family oxidoreductase [Nocardia beijingensis]MBF6466716.1 Gfo/Idh/MocA family oxidoreductase [Nocardia beijingensis]
MTAHSTTPLGVGIVGANPAGSWAAATHLPALAELPEFRVTAVATTNRASAAAAAEATGARHAFTDAAELAAHPEVDLVAVAVKSSGHAAVVRAALAAGKHVVCEWPMGASVAESAELTAAAVAAGVVHAVVLQGHHSPSVNFIKDLLAAGRIGAVSAITLVAAGDPFGGSMIRPELAWSADPGKGTGLLTIMAGHVLATLEHLAGELTEVSAVFATLHHELTVLGTGRTVPNSQPGQLAVAGRLGDGGIVAVTVHGGHADAPHGFTLYIRGAEGMLTITPVQSGMYPHWADWRIELRDNKGAVSELRVPDHYRLLPSALPAGPVAHVAGVYRETATAIAEGRTAHPDFTVGLRQRRLLDAVAVAAETGVRREVTAL